METITIEKVIKFDNIIDSIESVQVSNDLRYEVFDEDTHAKGLIKLNGSVNTVLGEKKFEEDVDVDIYTPFEKVIDKDNFKINLKDYSYMVNQQNLIVYLVLELDGIVTQTNIAKTEESVSNEELLNSMNNVNEIKETNNREVIEQVLKNNLEETNELKEEIKVNLNNDSLDEQINQSWATDLFKLTDNYSLFMKIHLK